MYGEYLALKLDQFKLRKFAFKASILRLNRDARSQTFLSMEWWGKKPMFDGIHCSLADIDFGASDLT